MIRRFQDARYASGPDALRRLYRFETLQKKSSSTQDRCASRRKLSISVKWQGKQAELRVKAGTKLTKWFEASKKTRAPDICNVLNFPVPLPGLQSQRSRLPGNQCALTKLWVTSESVALLVPLNLMWRIVVLMLLSKQLQYQYTPARAQIFRKLYSAIQKKENSFCFERGCYMSKALRALQKYV